MERVKKLYQRHHFLKGAIPPRRTIVDSAVTAQLGFGGYSDPVTLSIELEEYGWKVTGSPKSSRAFDWQLMKSLLWQGGSDQSGLFISELCESLWATLLHCISDDRNTEDMEKTSPDHSADVVRYVLTAANQGRHNFRTKLYSGAHPLMWKEERKGAVYRKGRQVGRLAELR